MGTPRIPRLVVAASIGLLTGAVMTHGLGIRGRSIHCAELQEKLRREYEQRAAANRWIAFSKDAPYDRTPAPAEPTVKSGGWLVFKLEDSLHDSGDTRHLGLRRPSEESLTLGRVAAALDAWGERELAQQAWEQTRRILGAESVFAAKEEVRGWLMRGDG